MIGMKRHVAIVLALMLIGCAGRNQTSSTQADSDFLKTLRAQRVALAADVERTRATLAKIQDEHPDLDEQCELARQETAQVSASLTDAKLETIDAKSKYAAGHPVVQSAAKREEELYSLYQQALKRMLALAQLALERDRLAELLREQREDLRRLDDRIAHLEDRRA